jgi:nucleoid-associated protein YgaU
MIKRRNIASLRVSGFMTERGEGIDGRFVRARCIAVGMVLTALVSVIPQIVKGATPSDGMVRVTMKEGQNLRDLARQHLGDPNLWTEILKASGLASVADARPGVEQRIPVTQVVRAGKAESSALDHIQAATQAARPGLGRPAGEVGPDRGGAGADAVTLDRADHVPG